MPGHGNFTALMSRIELYLTLWVPPAWVLLEVERFIRFAVAWRLFPLLDIDSMQENPRKKYRA